MRETLEEVFGSENAEKMWILVRGNMQCSVCKKNFTGIMQSYPICPECRLIAELIKPFGFNDVDTFIDEFKNGTIPEAESVYHTVLYLQHGGSIDEVTKE
jgi:hypothetical protein